MAHSISPNVNWIPNQFSFQKHFGNLVEFPMTQPTQCNFIHWRFSNNIKNVAINTMSCVTISMFITIIVHMQHWFIVTIVIIENNGTMKKKNLPTTCFTSGCPWPKATLKPLCEIQVPKLRSHILKITS